VDPKYHIVLSIWQGSRRPGYDPEVLSRVIVEAYVGYYQSHHPGLPVTQSAVSLAGIESVAEMVARC
jgi:hypothetical protein